jgi:multidrug efflux pump subunit AcrB
MNPIVFALRHPYTILVGIIALMLGSVLAATRMKIDIFPSLNLPAIYIVQPYPGMDPAQMEGLLTNYYEYHFLYISGIHHVESKNVQGVSLMKLVFHPGTDMAQAMAETIGYVNRARSFMPPGTVPPFVMRFDTGSVPVGYLVLKSATRSIGEIQDAALFKVRPMFASISGVSAPPPYGGNQRSIVIRVDPDRLRAQHVSLDEIMTALNSGNVISPSGNAIIDAQMPMVPINAIPKDPQELGTIPIRLRENVYLRDIAVIEDSTDVPTGYALVDGRRAVYILVTKRAEASTLSVVQAIKDNMQRMRDVLPEDVSLDFEFDQSPYVTRALWGVAEEGMIGAGLTGLMVLVFLRDWRSVLVVVLNIPFALLASVVGLWLSGESLNLMTLGGLALAVGILVDEATVEVENIHTQFEHAPSIGRAVRRGNQETAVPRLLAMLCILAVFIPSFFMEGAARGLFVPLSLAVGFSMIASYILSSTFVPVLSVWLLRHQHAAPTELHPLTLPSPPGGGEGDLILPSPPGGGEGRVRGSGTTNRSLTVAARIGTLFSVFSLERLRQAYGRLMHRLLPWRWPIVVAYLVVAGLLIWLLGSRLGMEIFPTIDTGQFQLRLRAADGTRIETTEEIAREALHIIDDVAGPGNVALTCGYLGLMPSSYTINTVYLFMRGPEEAVLRVALKHDSGVSVEELKHRLREELPHRLQKWVRARLLRQGLSADQAEVQSRSLKFSFEPADVINEVMSFGSPTPIEITVSGGSGLSESRAYAERIRTELARIPSLRDLQFGQSLDYPAVAVKVDRQRAGLSGVSISDVSRSLIASTSSTRFVLRNYWSDPKSGIGYQVQIEVPLYQMNSAEAIGNTPIIGHPHGGKLLAGQPLLVRDVASLQEGTMPGEYDRYNMRRLVSLTANIEGEDLGRVSSHVQRALLAAGKPPRGVLVDVRGQIVPYQQMFRGLTLGLALAVIVIFLLLTAYFQSPRLALVSVSAVPAVLAGVATMLLATGTTLNIQSFMGAIMAIGVAVSNAILLVTFAEENRLQGIGAGAAAARGAASRLRPILMTSCAMIAGMFPMSLALGEGGQQTAPLGRAVIGGLAAATLATLILLPSLFAVIMGGGKTHSASLDPDDPHSPHYCPEESHAPSA